MIKNLIFDLGGVVLPLHPEEAYRRFEQMGIKSARERMGVYGQTGIFRETEDGSIDAPTFCHKLAQIAQEESGAFAGEANPAFTFEQAQWGWLGYIDYVDQSRLDHLLELKQHYNVYLLSNTNPFMMAWADSDEFSKDGHPLSYYFHKLYYSYQMKAYKPAPEIFEQMLADAGIEASESLFLDDGPANVAAAQGVGLHALLVEKNEDWWEPLMQVIGKQ